LRERLVFPRELHVAGLLLDELHRARLRPRAQRRRMPIELAHVARGRLVVAASTEYGAPGGEERELAAAGGLRVRRHHGDVGSHEVRPVCDVLRIPAANHEDDGGRIRLRVVREPLGPAVGQESVLAQRVDVGEEREGDDVCLEPVGDLPCLRGGAAVRLDDRQAPAGGRFVVLDERRTEVVVQLAGRVVGDVEERPGGEGTVHAVRHDRERRDGHRRQRAEVPEASADRGPGAEARGRRLARRERSLAWPGRRGSHRPDASAASWMCPL
jgi:hypothetical protein